MKRYLIALCLVLVAFPAMARIIDGYDPNEKVRPYRLDADGRMIGWNLVIDACEATTDWTALSNDTTGIATDLDHVMGATSLEFDKVDGTDNTIFGGIQKTLTAIDLTTIVANGGSFTVSTNVSSLADIAYCFLRLGTSASHYNEWRVDDADMSTGWNSLRYNTDSPSSAGATGNGWDPAVVTYIAIGCAFDLETSALADLRVDHITARGGQQVSADINASSSSSSGPMAQVDVQQYGGNPVTTADADTGAGVDNLQRSINVVPAAGGAVIGTEDYDTGGGLDHVNRVGIKVPGAGGAVTITGVGGDLDIDISAQSLTAVKVSATAAANLVGNPIYVAVSKDAAANATANRIWATDNLDQIAGNAVAVDAGNTDTGTLRVVNSTDDPNLAVMSNWDDGNDRARTAIERDFLLDPLDATAGWTVGNNATANIALSSSHVEGSGSLTFDKVDGDNHTEAFIQKTIPSIDLIDFQSHSLVEWNTYVSDLSEVAYVFVRLGTDNANYSEWRAFDVDLTIGVWNTAVEPGGTVIYTVVGTGMLYSAITYLAVGVSFDAENDTLTSIGVDVIATHESHHSTSTISAEVTSSVNSANINLFKVGNQPTAKNTGVATNGTQRVTVATGDILTVSATDAANTSSNPIYTSSAGAVSTTVAQGPTATGGGTVLVLNSTDISKESCWGLTLENVGANPFTDADVQISRDLGTTWTPLTWTSCDTVAAAATCDYDFPLNSYTNVRVYVTSGVATSVDVTFSSRR